MNRLIFLVEGQADAAFLRAFLPQIGVVESRFAVVSHEGKDGLISEFHQAMRSWREPGSQFVILVDQDRDDCRELKRRIQSIARAKCKNQAKRLLVRVACREAEAWYLGDLAALREAYPDVRAIAWRKINRRKNPDDRRDPKPSELLREIPGFAKMDAAEKMGEILGRKNPDNNCSVSYRRFVEGVMKMLDA